MRIGIGYDIHPLKKGKKLRLGGVDVPHAKGLVGHSDGDALLHAIVDAALGAMGEGDIGVHFPCDDPAYKNADSVLFVQKTKKLLKQKKLKISHVDSTIIAEEPKFNSLKERMRDRISDLFGVPVSSVGVKAKSNEGFGEIGKGRAIACLAVVSLKGRG